MNDRLNAWLRREADVAVSAAAASSAGEPNMEDASRISNSRPASRVSFINYKTKFGR